MVDELRELNGAGWLLLSEDERAAFREGGWRDLETPEDEALLEATCRRMFPCRPTHSVMEKDDG